MKKLMLLVVAFAATLTFGSAAAQAATITISTPGVVSGPFDVTVQASNLFDGRDITTDAVFGFGFDVSVSGTLAFTGATAGSLFDPVSSIPGTDVFALASGAQILPGVGEPILLATLHFDVLGTGPASIFITSNLADPNQGLLFFNEPFAQAIAGTVPVTAAAPVPEPATLVLSSLGLLGMASLRRFRARRVA